MTALRGSAELRASVGIPASGCDARDHRSNEADASSERHSERWSLGRLVAILFFLPLFEDEEKIKRAGADARPRPRLAHTAPGTTARDHRPHGNHLAHQTHR